MAIIACISVACAIALMIIVGPLRLIPWWVIPIAFLVSSFIFGWLVEYHERTMDESPILSIVALIMLIIAFSTALMFFIFPNPIGLGGG